MQAVHLSGGLGRNRTTDTRIFNPLLYQLSYQALGKKIIARGLRPDGGSAAALAARQIHPELL